MIRLVLWRQAFDCISNAAARELQAIITACRPWPIGKTKTIQCLVQQNPGIITGKWAAGAVCPMHSRRQSDNKQFCVGVTKWRHRLCVITRVIVLDLVEIAYKPRAISAFHAETGVC